MQWDLACRRGSAASKKEKVGAMGVAVFYNLKLEALGLVTLAQPYILPVSEFACASPTFRA